MLGGPTPLTCHGTPANRQPRLQAQLAQAFLSQFQSFHLCLLVPYVCCTSVAINNERGTAWSASTPAHRPSSSSASRLLVSASPSVVVSHAVTVPPFPILRSRQGFGESISCVRLGRFLDHYKLLLFVFR